MSPWGRPKHLRLNATRVLIGLNIQDEDDPPPAAVLPTHVPCENLLFQEEQLHSELKVKMAEHTDAVQ